MIRLTAAVPAFMLAVLAPNTAGAFSNCASNADLAAYRSNSAYRVGELAIDTAAGSASGTETHYNYSNTGDAGLHECHVTYELSGVYDSASALLLLDAQRTNQSHGCDPRFVASQFPAIRSYTYSLTQSGDERVGIIDAASGVHLALGDIGGGALSYRTAETCRIE